MEIVIEEIHNTIRTFVEKSKKRIIVKNVKVEAEDSAFLKSIGFSSTDNVKKYEANKSKESKRNIKKENYNLALSKAKEHYEKYGIPCVSIDVVKEICKKYKLITVGASSYTGNIPKKNIEELKKFKGIDDEDVPYIATTFRHLNDSEKKEIKKTKAYLRRGLCHMMSISTFERETDLDLDNLPLPVSYDRDGYIEEEVFTSSDETVYSNFWTSHPRLDTKLRIICPPSEANLKLFSYNTPPHVITFDVARNLGSEILDPIALIPVSGAKRADSDHLTPMFLIPSMWGLESFDSKLNPSGNIDSKLNLN